MEEKKGKKRSGYGLALVLILLAAACLFLWQQTRQEPAGEEKTLLVEVIHGDGSSREFSVTTRQDYLGPALEEEGLILGEEGPYGIFIIEVDGERADGEQQQWWCLSQNDGESVATGADTTPIQEGDKFELTLKTGY